MHKNFYFLLISLIVILITSSGAYITTEIFEHNSIFCSACSNTIIMGVVVLMMIYLSRITSESVCIIDNSLNCIKCNRAFAKLLGYNKKKDVIGLNLSDIFHQDSVAEIKEILLKAINGKEAKSEILSLRPKNSDEFIAESSFFKNNQGHIIFALVDVSKHTAIAKLLKKQDEHYKEMFLKNPCIELFVDKDSDIITDCNIAAGIFYGASSQNIIGKSYRDIANMSDERHNDLKKMLIEKGTIKDISTHRTLTGETKFVECNWSTVEIGGKELFYGIINDISENVRIERALKESEKRYRELAYHISSSLAILEPIDNGNDFIIKDINRSAEKMFGRGREHYINIKASEIVNEVWDKEPILEKTREAYKSGLDYYQAMAQTTDASGKDVWLEMFFYRLPSGEFVYLHNNITDRINADIEIQQKETNLRKRIKELNFLYYFSDLFGPPLPRVDKILNRLLSSIDKAFLYPSSTAVKIILNGETIQTPNYKETPWQLNSDIKINKNKIGSITIAYIDEKPIRDVGPFLREELSLLEEITSRLGRYFLYKEIEEKMRRTAKMEAVATLTGGMAHDFNNILTGIMGHCYILNEKTDEDDKRKNNIKHVMQASKRAQELVQQLLDFCRIGSHKNEKINLQDIVLEALELTGPSIPNNILVSFNNDSDKNIYINGSSSQLHQVIINIVSNSVAAIDKPNGHINVILDEVTITETTNRFNLSLGDYARITITDDGKGMPEDVLKRAFDPFFTTKDVGKGTGLGLSVALGIIEEHNGAVHLSSPKNSGAKVVIMIPTYDNNSWKNERQNMILYVGEDGASDNNLRDVIEIFNNKLINFNSSFSAINWLEDNVKNLNFAIIDYDFAPKDVPKIYETIRAFSNNIAIILLAENREDAFLQTSSLGTNMPIVQKPVYSADIIKEISKIKESGN